MKETMRTKITEEMNRFTSFKKQTVTKINREKEIHNFEKEMVVRVFGEDQMSSHKFTIANAYEQLERRNTELGGVADELLVEYKKECKQFNKLICAERYDNYGEKQVVHRLNYLNGTNRIVRNIQLENENGTTELDMLVFNPKAIFIIEVKNTKKDIQIHESGACYNVGEHKCYDGNLKEKMDFRESLLRETLAGTMVAGNKALKIVKLVVYTNKVGLQNKCKGLQLCFLGQLPYLINEFSGRELYTEEEIIAMAAIMENVKNTQEYEFEMDMQKFKEDFATLLVTLEEAEEATRDKIVAQVVSTSEKKIFKLFRWIGSFMPAA